MGMYEGCLVGPWSQSGVVLLPFPRLGFGGWATHVLCKLGVSWEGGETCMAGYAGSSQERQIGLKGKEISVYLFLMMMFKGETRRVDGTCSERQEG